MRSKPGGNGSGKFQVDQQDMGGWVRISARGHDLPADLPVFLSQSLTDWFRKRPHFFLRCVTSIQRDGDTVELHAWYVSHIFPVLQGPKPTD
jgi:hypothetical protein